MITVLCKLLFASFCSLFTTMPYEIVQVNPALCDVGIVEGLKKFETRLTYPFSDTETFMIEYGKNGSYFDFFKSLGTPYYYVAFCTENKEVIKTINNEPIQVKHQVGDIAAVGCGVLRTVPTKNRSTTQAWYVCDLKVGAAYQGEHLPLLIIQQAATRQLLRCPRGYGICMNPKTGDPKAAAIFKKHSLLQGLKTEILNFYCLSADQAEASFDLIKHILINRGYMKQNEELFFASTSGLKDYLILNSTKQSTRPWQLFHAQRKEIKEKNNEIGQQYVADGTYMLCSINETGLDSDLKKLFDSPKTTAQIVSYGMDDIDFNFLTSNQI